MELGPLKIGTFRFFANLKNVNNWDFMVFDKLRKTLKIETLAEFHAISQLQFHRTHCN